MRTHMISGDKRYLMISASPMRPAATCCEPQPKTRSRRECRLTSVAGCCRLRLPRMLPSWSSRPVGNIGTKSAGKAGPAIVGGCCSGTGTLRCPGVVAHRRHAADRLAAGRPVAVPAPAGRRTARRGGEYRPAVDAGNQESGLSALRAVVLQRAASHPRGGVAVAVTARPEGRKSAWDNAMRQSPPCPTTSSSLRLRASDRGS